MFFTTATFRIPHLVQFLISKMIWGFGANAPFDVRYVYAETFGMYRTMLIFEVFLGEFG